MGAVQLWLMLQIRLCGYPICLQCFELAGLTSDSFVKVLVIEIFSSVLGLFGLIIGLLVSGKAPDFDVS